MYILVVLVALVGAFAYHTRDAGIFACQAGDYGDDHYLGYCNGTAYADYDHGAVWFGLEPEVRAKAAAADVVFLGNSRLQFGFSAPATGQFFSDAGANYYLLGFSDNETFKFTGPLLKSLQPKAKAYVINVDKFFFDRESPPAAAILHDPGARERYANKRAWQGPHRLICGALPFACDDALAFYRDRATGEWRFDGSKGLKGAAAVVKADRPVYAKGNPKLVAEVTANARAFIAGLGVPPACVILTYVPSPENNRLLANAIAAAVGQPLIAPPGVGLRTLDGSHLDRDSAETFSTAFFAEAGPRLMQCLSGELTSAASAPVIQ